MEIIKDFFSIEVITLLVAFATLVFTLWSFIDSRKRERRQIRAQIKRKQRYLETLELYNRAGRIPPAESDMNYNIDIIKEDIEQLKKLL